MDEASRPRGELGQGGHFIVAVTGSANSEYLIRWADSTVRRLNGAWTALHVRRPGQGEDSPGLERNLALARNLGAEIASLVDTDAAACIVRYARIKKAQVLVIGKADEGSVPLLGRRSVMDEILKRSGDLDVILLRGKQPVPIRRVGTNLSRAGRLRGVLSASCALASVTILGLAAQPALGYRSVSILYLLAIITLPFFASRPVVFAGAAMSALLWNFLFIPPQLTFSIASLEDLLMFAAFFLAAFVGGFLTSRLKEKEWALSLRERRMAFLYGFTLSISKERGRDGILRFAESYLLDHLGLASVVLLCDSSGSGAAELWAGTSGNPGSAGYSAELAERCLRTKESLMDGQSRMYLPLAYQESALGVLFVSAQAGKGAGGQADRKIAGENRELLAALSGNIALVLERERLSQENERNKLAGESARLAKILLNHVSHELRTPLTTIKGAVSGLLEAETAEDPKLRNALLAETMIASNRLNSLVEDLLAMSRLESGRLLPRIEPAYLGELVGAARRALGDELEGRTVLFEGESKDGEIEADPVLLTQVFRNILRNFAAYTPPGSALRIAYGSGSDGMDRILFADDGPGVPGAELPLLFDTFYRGSGSGKAQGCGLGLAICRGIVEAHGGTIEAGKAEEGGLALVLRLRRSRKP